MTEFYATDGFVHSHPVAGAIEISHEQYLSGVDASVNGTGRILIKDGLFSIGSIEKKKVYNTTDGSRVEIYEDEPIPDGYCDKERKDYEAEWDGTEWIIPESVLTLREIHSLEEKITPRRLREAALGDADSVAFIADIENQISILRSQL